MSNEIFEEEEILQVIHVPNLKAVYYEGSDVWRSPAILCLVKNRPEGVEPYTAIEPYAWVDGDKSYFPAAGNNFLGLEFDGQEKDWTKSIIAAEKRKQEAMK